MRIVQRIRLWRRLLALAVQGWRLGEDRSPAAREARQRLFSEVEAIHRDLGHHYHPDLIRPEHR